MEIIWQKKKKKVVSPHTENIFWCWISFWNHFHSEIANKFSKTNGKQTRRIFHEIL